MRIVSVGEITLDHYLGLEQSFVGGISLNFAIHAKRSGAKQVALMSRVGSEDGQVVLDKLEQEKIDSRHVRVLRGKTASIDIQVLSNGERVFPKGGYHENVLKDFQLGPRELGFIQEHEVLVTLFDSRQGSHFEQLMRLEFSGKRIVDFGDWSRRKTELAAFLTALEGIDLAFISGTEETVEALLPYTKSDGLIVVTLGAQGSIALAHRETIAQAAQKVIPVDATGCGDAFQAAFTVHYYQTGDIHLALQAGAKQAARVLQQYGAS